VEIQGSLLRSHLLFKSFELECALLERQRAPVPDRSWRG
jgi:hypothetical protein